MTDPAGAYTALSDLSAAFAARDVDHALACYTGHEDISYVGSEAGELAHGRPAVTRLLAELFARPEAYSWQSHAVVVHHAGAGLHVTAEATGCTTRDDGGTDEFVYRLSGLLQLVEGVWRWRVCIGAEPTA